MAKRGFAGISAALLAALSGLVQPAAADITVGLVAPITGDNAPTGAQLQNGAEAAVAEINAHGGVLGEKLALAIEDDGCNARRAVSMANRLVGENIGFIVGPWCSAVDVPASSIFADAGTIEISLAANDRITEQGFDGLFRINGRNDQQSGLLAGFIAKHHAGKRVALVADRSAYATGLMAGLRAALKAQGAVTVVLDQSIDAGTKDFSPLISSFKNNAVDVVTYVGFPTEASLIMIQINAAGLKLPFVSANTLTNHQVWDIAGKSAIGTAFTCQTAADLLPAAQDAVAALKAKGKKADGYTLYAYAGVQLVAEALIRAKTTHADAVADALQKGGIPTVLGTVSFDDKGDIAQPIWRVCRWNEGGYAYYPGE
jgi:branched-chain amino acid transport system substrate-binding protein